MEWKVNIKRIIQVLTALAVGVSAAYTYMNHSQSVDKQQIQQPVPLEDLLKETE